MSQSLRNVAILALLAACVGTLSFALGEARTPPTAVAYTPPNTVFLVDADVSSLRRASSWLSRAPRTGPCEQTLDQVGALTVFVQRDVGGGLGDIAARVGGTVALETATDCLREVAEHDEDVARFHHTRIEGTDALASDTSSTVVVPIPGGLLTGPSPLAAQMLRVADGREASPAASDLERRLQALHGQVRLVGRLPEAWRSLLGQAPEAPTSRPELVSLSLDIAHHLEVRVRFEMHTDDDAQRLADRLGEHLLALRSERPWSASAFAPLLAPAVAARGTEVAVDLSLTESQARAAYELLQTLVH